MTRWNKEGDGASDGAAHELAEFPRKLKSLPERFSQKFSRGFAASQLASWGVFFHPVAFSTFSIAQRAKFRAKLGKSTVVSKTLFNGKVLCLAFASLNINIDRVVRPFAFSVVVVQVSSPFLIENR